MSEPLPPGSPGTFDRLIESLILRVEAEGRRVDLIEARVLPLLERIAVALENPRLAPTSGFSVGDGARTSALARFREALKQRDWDLAESILAEFPPDGPDAPRLAEERGRAQSAALDDLRGRLDASRTANDPVAAIDLRDQMAPLLAGDPLRVLDHTLVKWLMGLIQRRLRGGRIGPDVVELAAMVADRFGGTPEGASLRAALPTLRRSAGLCPRCGEPYVGDEDACPKCRAEVAPAPPAGDFGPPVEDEEEIVEAEPLDLNNERNWESPSSF